MLKNIQEIQKYAQFDLYTVNKTYVLQLFDKNDAPNDLGVSCIWEDSSEDLLQLINNAINWCKENIKISHQKACKKFYEYCNYNGPMISEVTSPFCPTWGSDPDVFLVYAEDKDKAFQLAQAHIYDGKPLEKFYGNYKGEHYSGDVLCVM